MYEIVQVVREAEGVEAIEKYRERMQKLIKKKEESLNSNHKEELKIKDLKEKFKDINKFNSYLIKNNINMGNLELIDYLDSGSESNVYSINILRKNKKGQEIKTKAIMKAIFYQKKERENKKEIIISSKLKNKNIIDFYAYSPIKTGQSYFFAMEYAKFGNLRNFQRNILKRARLTESMLCFLGSQILNALNYCHKCKIAHMDIKLQNVVIDESLNTKLIDFSVSLNYKDKKLTNEIKLPYKGTNFYMPKEVMQSDRIQYKDLNKVDLYAFGVILYNLAFGCYPYGLTYGDENNYYKILEKMKRNKLNLINDMNYSKHFLDFLRSLLEKDIDKRIGINEALQHYWIKGADLLKEEKEKCYAVNIFVSYLLTDNIKSFNDYLANQNDRTNDNEQIQNILNISSNQESPSNLNYLGTTKSND